MHQVNRSSRTMMRLVVTVIWLTWACAVLTLPSEIRDALGEPAWARAPLICGYALTVAAWLALAIFFTRFFWRQPDTWKTDCRVSPRQPATTRTQ